MSNHKSQQKKYHYLLVNPYIEGDMDKIYEGSTPQNAAKKVWESMSEYIANFVPEMYITLERAGGGSLHHFKIKESKVKNKQNPKLNVKYSIEPYTNNISSESLSSFKEQLEEAKAKGKLNKAKHSKKLEKMKGGKKKDLDDDSSSDSDDDYYKRSNKMKLIESQKYILYWWYDPLIYSGIKTYTVPTLISPLYPPMEILLANGPLYYIPN